MLVLYKKKFKNLTLINNLIEFWLLAGEHLFILIFFWEYPLESAYLIL